MSPPTPFTPIICIVDFHHARGPEVETWFGVPPNHDPAVANDWPLLPFMALADGAHTSTEDFSYFSLRYAGDDNSSASGSMKEASGIIGKGARSLFGISCTRQIDANELIDRPPEVTRSTVQKAVVVIAESPEGFGMLRERLSVVTKAWFAQRDFTDQDILQRFQESLPMTLAHAAEERDRYLGISLRELIHEYKYLTLVLFKCCLLQPKMLFFGSHCERVCMMQFAFISLIPGLIRNLQDCADPQFNSYEETHVMPTSLRTSERSSLLSYMGLPLQIFGKGSLFGPYTPLQQLDMLADHGTKSYVVGSTNPLLLQQKDRYSDILINLDDQTTNISSTSLRTALNLTTPDRRWIDFLTQAVNDTWDESNPERPKQMGYAGSEEFIRLQFEEYTLALLSSIKYRQFVEKHKDDPKALLSEVDGDPAGEFGNDWIDAWMRTENYRLFNKFTDSHLFDIVEPRHPCAGGLTIEDVQRRLATQVAELHLDERWQTSRDTITKNFSEGQKKVSSAFNNLWADIEVMREAQRKRHEEQKAAAAASGAISPTASVSSGGWGSSKPAPRGPDWSQAQASVQAASSRAGAYLSSWGSWASEKRKTGWGRSASGQTQSPPPADSNRPSTTTVAELAKEERKAASKEEGNKEVVAPPASRVPEETPKGKKGESKGPAIENADSDEGGSPGPLKQTHEEATFAEEKSVWNE
ncbi:MAG: late secretory pathway protein avl9 [Bogoriella megaspora]|nr:MAG: late secretory pathway protein avl9 [Bogoriella megaspora]